MVTPGSSLERLKARGMVLFGVALVQGAALLVPGAAPAAVQTEWTVNSSGNQNDGNLGDGRCDTGSGRPGDPYTGVCPWPAVVQEINALGGAHIIRFTTFLLEVSNFSADFGHSAPVTEVTIDGPARALPVEIPGEISFGDPVRKFTIRNIWFTGDPDPNLAAISTPVTNPATTSAISDCTIENSFFTGSSLTLFVGGPRSVSNCHITNNKIGIDPAGNAVGNRAAIYQWLGNGNEFVNNTIAAVAIARADSDPLQGDCFFFGMNIFGNNNLIHGNKIGTDQSGLTALPNFGGICIQGDSNTVTQNVVSGNKKPASVGDERVAGSGLVIFGDHNEVWNNKIGTDALGSSALGNGHHGVVVFGHDNCIGALFVGDTDECRSTLQTDPPEKRNVISGNEGHGIAVFHVDDARNVILINTIGLDVSRTIAVRNGGDGILIEADTNEVRANVISANGKHGVEVIGDRNVISRNFVGTDGSGLFDFGNANHGILVNGAFNVVGGEVPGTSALPSNLISGNGGDGIHITAPPFPSLGSTNAVFGNWIGLNLDGTGAIKNDGHGIHVTNDARNTVIGIDPPGGPTSTNANAGNVISGNVGDGIRIETSRNLIHGNHIGVEAPSQLNDPPLLRAVPNGGAGVRIMTSQFNRIGTERPILDELGLGNVISGNAGPGIWLAPGAKFTFVQSNFIGVDLSMKGPIPNSGEAGLIIDTGTRGNVIGGEGPDSIRVGNVISGNAGHGVVIRGDSTQEFLNNRIGTDLRGRGFDPGAGGQSLGNTGSGIVIEGGSDNTIGGPLGPNIIGDNGGHGILLTDSAESNELDFNFIGTGLKFETASNALDGIHINAGANLNLIKSNTIWYNVRDGVRVDGTGSLRNTISVNSIHANTAKGIENISGGNTELPPPTATVRDTVQVEGQACANCDVEVFSDSARQGQFFEKAARADANGNFQVTGPFLGPRLTCTATDTLGNTSEFGCALAVDPSFKVTKRDTDANGGDLLAGDTLDYAIEIVNRTTRSFPARAASNELEDSIPQNTTYVAGSIRVNGAANDDDTADGIGFDAATNKVIWNGSVPPQGGVTIDFRVKISPAVQPLTVISNQGFLVLGVDSVGFVTLSRPTDDPDTPEAEDSTKATVVAQRPPGDVDGDGQVTVGDVVRVADFVLGRATPTATERAAADFNGDGDVNVGDVVAIVNHILGRMSRQATTVVAERSSRSPIRMVELDEGARSGYRLELRQPVTVAGVQLRLPGAWEVAGVPDGFITAEKTEAGETLVLLYSLEGATVSTKGARVMELIGNFADPRGTLMVVDSAGAVFYDGALVASPAALSLSVPYPNPALIGHVGVGLAGTRFRITVPESSEGSLRVQVAVYSVRGQRVAVPVDEALASGVYERSWDGTNSRGELVSSGIYYLVMRAGGEVFRRTLTVIRC